MLTQEYTTPKSLVFASGVASSAWLDVACTSFFLVVDLLKPIRPEGKESILSEIIISHYSLRDMGRSINSILCRYYQEPIIGSWYLA